MFTKFTGFPKKQGRKVSTKQQLVLLAGVFSILALSISSCQPQSAYAEPVADDQIANEERRSQANMIEYLIESYYQDNYEQR